VFVPYKDRNKIRTTKLNVQPFQTFIKGHTIDLFQLVIQSADLARLGEVFDVHLNHRNLIFGVGVYLQHGYVIRGVAEYVNRTAIVKVVKGLNITVSESLR
jgi:hypothetical protein